MKLKKININGVINGVNEFNKNNNFNQKQNIMKKSFLFLAVAASFAACTSNDQINDDLQGDEIRFDQVLNKTTKAEIVDEAALASAGGFAVFGYKSTDANNAVFDAVNVYRESVEGANSVWKYDVTRYWDKNATYRFYAVAPFDPESGSYSIDKTTGMFTVTGVKSGLASASDDFIIDRNGVTDVDGATANGGNAVTFDFHHIMAKLSFTVKTNMAAGTDIKITSLVMKNWNSNDGSFTQDLSETPNQLNTEEWTAIEGTNGSVSLVDVDAPIALETDAQGLPSYIMVPQDIANLAFDITYTITEDEYTETFNHTAELGEQIWGTDSHITYNLTIGAAEIKFDVNSICGFDAAQNDDKEEDINVTPQQ